MRCKRMPLEMLLLVLVMGCPASNQTEANYPTNEGTPPAQRGMTAEQYEEIKRVERVGQPGLTACYTDELERRNDKKLEGKVTVEIDIGTTGSATQVRIIRSTLTNAPLVSQCIQQQIMKWEFPRLTSPAQYGTTFAFSPAY